MARKRVSTKTTAAKAKALTPIVYEHHPAWGRLVRGRLALAKAYVKAMKKGQDAPGPEKDAAKARLRELMRRAQELDALEHRMDESAGRVVRDARHAIPLPRLTHVEYFTIGPTRVEIGYFVAEPTGGHRFEASNLIYGCPDDGMGHHWSAWFSNGQVYLRRYGRNVIKGPAFTGRVRTTVEALAEGVADIEEGGSVTLATYCYASVWRPIGEDPNITWMQVATDAAVSVYPQPATTTPGLVSLNRSFKSLEFAFAEAHPGDVVETRQEIWISAVGAEVQLGPNRSDCAAGGHYGFLKTPPPILELDYFNLRTRIPEERPHWMR